LKSQPDDKTFLMKLAKAKFKDRQNLKALSILQSIKKGSLSDNDKIDILQVESLIYWRLDRDKDFETACNKIIEKGSTRAKRKALFNLAGYNLEKRKLAEAEKYFKKVLTLDPDPSVRADVKWKLAWIKYWEHNYTTAANFFREIRLTNSPKLDIPSKYWQARCYLLLNNKKEAEPLLKDIIQARPLDYYATEAARLMKTMGVHEVSTDNKAPFPEVQLNHEQLSNPVIAAAVKLMENGLNEFAVLNLESLPKSTRLTPPIAMLHAKALYNSGKYTQAQEALSTTFSGFMENPPENAPADFIEIAFPRIHLKDTINMAQKHSIDPHLVWAIIRQESRYDAAAVSPAGALGLMQVMPSSAGIVKKEGKVPAKAIEDILNPKKNIEYGVKILARNLNHFQGKLVPAVASYNADIKKVQNWVTRNDKMKVDEFVESIPYLETRLYVKKVIANYRAYSKLHKKKDLVGLW
jgi:soluble lytic murein transglycosylase